MTTNQLITKIGRQRVVTALSNVVCSGSSSGGGTWGSITGTLSDQTDLAAALALKLDKIITANRQTDSYTPVLGDAYKLVEMNKATANNFTVPLNSSVAYDIGTSIYVSQYGAGQTTIVATGGVTINSSSGSLLIPSQYSVVHLLKIATNEWYLFNGSDPDSAWVDWSASLSPTGFSSVATQVSYYKARGDEVTMFVFISGTSNTNAFTFQIPFAVDSAYGSGGIVYNALPTDNGTVVNGRITGSGGSTTINVHATIVGGAFTTSGVKALRCQLTYMK